MTILPSSPKNDSTIRPLNAGDNVEKLTPGELADQAAAFYRFQDYQQRRSEQSGAAQPYLLAGRLDQTEEKPGGPGRFDHPHRLCAAGHLRADFFPA